VTSRFNPEDVDLAKMVTVLQQHCGPSVSGPVVGRTLLRDELVRQLGCSQLQGEFVVDTMIGRGFLVRRERPGHPDEWVVGGR
jgi:hypothetical protein